MAARVRRPGPAGQLRDPLGLGDELRDPFRGGRRLAPGTRPRGLPPVLRRSPQWPGEALAARHGRGRPGRSRGPPPPRAALPRSRTPGSRSGPESRPDSRGHLRPRMLARPDLLTAAPRPPPPPPATRGRGCPELPARRTPCPPTPRAPGLSREPGSPGRPLLEGGFPAERARSWAAPHASPGLAPRGLDLESSGAAGKCQPQKGRGWGETGKGASRSGA